MIEQILAHLVGDYVLQTDHMADRKTKSFAVAYWHGFVYSIPFWFFVPLTVGTATGFWLPNGGGHFNLGALPIPNLALFLIITTHAIIDRYRLARYVVWAKNQLAPAAYRYPFSKAAWHGYQDGKPEWLAGWLLIIADNTIHLLCNYLALRYL